MAATSDADVSPGCPAMGLLESVCTIRPIGYIGIRSHDGMIVPIPFQTDDVG
ncbi:hypothetical protein [Azospirillum endophyticum]